MNGESQYKKASSYGVPLWLQSSSNQRACSNIYTGSNRSKGPIRDGFEKYAFASHQNIHSNATINQS